MGDRANFYMHSSDRPHIPGIYIYSHWHGDRLPYLLQETLKCFKNLWGDEQYFNGELMYQLHRRDESSGFSVEIGDGKSRVITIDHDKQWIEFQGYDIPAQSFMNFCAVDLDKTKDLMTLLEVKN